MAYNPPIGSIYHIYTTYILPSGGLYATATYHLFWEPETTSEYTWVGFSSPTQCVTTEPSRGGLITAQWWFHNAQLKKASKTTCIYPHVAKQAIVETCWG